MVFLWFSYGFPQVALALPLAALLDRALPGVTVGAVSGVSSMTEEQRAVAKSWRKDVENMGKTRENHRKTIGKPMVLLIIIPMKNGYFIGKINPIFRETHCENKGGKYWTWP